MELCALAWETGELVEREEKKAERRVRTEEVGGRKEERGGRGGGKRESKAQAGQAVGSRQGSSRQKRFKAMKLVQRVSGGI